MPWRVYREWQAFFCAEPFGDEADGVRLGYAAAALGNLLGKPKGKKAWRPSDFIPEWQFESKELSPDQQLDKMILTTQMMGGKIIDRRGERGKSD